MDDKRRIRIDAVEEALCDAALAASVDVVLRATGDGEYSARSHAGRVTFRHGPDGTRIVETTGTDPLVGDGDDARPHAHDEIAQYFDSPLAPDLAVVRPGADRYHGNVGEHGSLARVQRRAPFVAAGPGVAARGWVPGSARTVDVAPTVAALGGIARRTGLDRWGRRVGSQFLGRQDGGPIDSVFGADHDPERQDPVLLVLWDGVNADAFRAAMDDGDLPHARSVLDRGIGLDGGVLASFPSATLANHTSIGTGALPGHSGVLHNEWRAAGRHPVNLLDPDAMWTASTHIGPTVETLHEAFHRTDPDAWTAAGFEYCDRGADLSTFRLLPDAAARIHLPLARRDDAFDRDEQWWETSEQFAFISRVDETTTRIAERWWDGWSRDADHPAPRFAYVNFDLPDATGHEGGPHSPIVRAALRDTDRRFGRLLQAIERAGCSDDTAVVLVADHGMQHTEATAAPPWDAALAGLPHTILDGTMVYVD